MIAVIFLYIIALESWSGTVQLKVNFCLTVQINKQRANLLETTRQNGELAQALQKKDEELDRHLERLAEQEHIMKQKDGCIQLLSDKEEEQTKIIKLLRNNLEMRTQADVDVSTSY